MTNYGDNTRHSVHADLLEDRVIETYTIEILREGYVPGATALAAIIAETEENLTDLLPHGVRARIRPWNEE